MNKIKAFWLIRSLMNEHGLRAWHFRFDNSKKRFGICYGDNPQFKHRHKSIQLSGPLSVLNSEEEIRKTTLHEIAHALTWDEKEHHGPKWREVVVAIGGESNRCYNPQTINRPTGKYTATCSGCGATFNRHRLTRYLRTRNKFICNRCGTEFEYDGPGVMKNFVAEVPYWSRGK